MGGKSRREDLLRRPQQPIPNATCLNCGGPVEPFWNNRAFLCRQCNVRWSRRLMLIQNREAQKVVALIEKELQLKRVITLGGML